MAEASFTGGEFLKYAFDGNTEGDSFVLHFKTKKPAGLLYHMGKSTFSVIINTFKNYTPISLKSLCKYY